MSAEDHIVMEGVVISATRDIYTVEFDNKHTARCHIAGKVRQNKIRIHEGDKVRVEVSAYDLSRGRITFRL